MKIFLNWFIGAIAIMISAYILPGVYVSGILVALVLAVVLGAINAFIKPVLVILTLPINILTLGLFTLVINGLLVMLASTIVPGFTVDGFWWALLFALTLSVVNAVFGAFGGSGRD
ncbi:MAG: phage holin family protein [Candidatus Paceibacterota bacterium]